MTTIFWAGDSTAAHNSILTWPQTGIAQMFDRFLDRENVRVDNHAVNGRSTKSFLDQGRLAPIAQRLGEGDFLFVQFGHNDEKESDPDRYTDPDSAFGQNLKIFVDCAREKGAVPVIISPVTRRGFTDPAAVYRHDRWAAAARKTAKALDAAFIDLTRMSEELLIHTPQEKLDDWFMPDGTHLKPEGALVFAGLVAQGLHRLGGEYQKLLFAGFEEYLQKGKRMLELITLRQQPERLEAAAEWFHSKWGVPPEAYRACMQAYLDGETEYGWYLCTDGQRIIGGLGVIENDFHDRKDLSPNICAVYVEKAYRCQGIAGRLLDMAVEDLRTKGISPVYLLTDHTGFYERYGWQFLCMAQGDGEEQLSRIYIHH